MKKLIEESSKNTVKKKVLRVPMPVVLVILDGWTNINDLAKGQYYGGGFNPSPHAMPDDGILDVYFVKKPPLINI